VVPLQRIIASLPLELHPHVLTQDTEHRLVQVPLEKVLPQLSRGAVRLTFGELRRLAPDVFAAATDRDASLVPLPLGEILSQLNPALITRRRVQRHVEVPEEISSPFDPSNHARITGAPPAKASGDTDTLLTSDPVGSAQESAFEPRGTTPTGQVGHRPPPALDPPPAQVSLVRPRHDGNGKPANPLPTAHLPPPPSSPASAKPNGQGNSNANRNGNGNGKPNGSHGIATPQGGPSAASRFNLPSEPVQPASANSVPQNQQPPRTPSAHTNPLGAPAKARFDGVKSGEAPIVAALSRLAEAWPEPIRKEILEFGLVEAEVNIPAEVLEQGLKQGRVVVTWKTLREWLRPPATVKVSPADATTLELPLKVVAPLFLARQKERLSDRQKVEVDKEIPNLFFGFPQPEAPKTTAEDTNYYIWDDATEQVSPQTQQVAKPTNSPGTKFVSKYATPNEVVSRAAALEGVAGALIALPDGLLVASRLSNDLNSETIAAFLPQIFGKVSQSTKELRMGELNNLNFTVGNVPWKIFRVNAIYFAAFGRAGEPLPTAQLAALAAELDHNK